MFIGYIYKISSPQTEEVYIGSTTREIRFRLSEHRNKFKMYLDKRYGFTTSFNLIQHHDHVIEILATVQCADLNQLYLLEKQYIKMTPNCCNKIIHNENNRILECPCGGHFTKYRKHKHLKSLKHREYIENNNI